MLPMKTESRKCRPKRRKGKRQGRQGDDQRYPTIRETSVANRRHYAPQRFPLTAIIQDEIRVKERLST